MKKKNAPRGSADPKTMPEICLFILCAVVCLSLVLFTLDGNRYTDGEEAVECSLSYSPPKKAEAMGFWDILSDSLSRLLSLA